VSTQELTTLPGGREKLQSQSLNWPRTQHSFLPPGYNGKRKFSLPQLGTRRFHQDDDDDEDAYRATSSARAACPFTSTSALPTASPRRILRSLSASLRALRDLARRDEDDDEDGEEEREQGEGGEHRRNNYKEDADDDDIQGGCIRRLTAGSKRGKRAAMIAEGSTSTVASASSSLLSQEFQQQILSHLSTCEGYQFLFDRLAIKIVHHSQKTDVIDEILSREKTELEQKNESSCDDDDDDGPLSAEQLLRKYFMHEMEQKQNQKRLEEEVEGDDISVVVFSSSSELTFDKLLSKIRALYSNPNTEEDEEEGSDVDDDLNLDDTTEEEGADLAIFYDDSQGNRMHVHDTESLMHALNDWRDHQKKIRRQLKLEERRERWKKQIEVRGRERRKEMLTKIGDSMAMLSPRQSMARGQPSLLQQLELQPTTEEMNEAEKEKQRERMRGSSLKFHVYQKI